MKDDDGVYTLSIDFERFQKICDIQEIFAFLEDKPKIALLCMSAALHKVQSSSGWIVGGLITQLCTSFLYFLISLMSITVPEAGLVD